ncbi:MAG: hypothetical protein FGO69_08420 [Methanobacterium sp.]|nr:MAG: hypothetical protein FGO69_08420 [Methanobacterium sp.]
MIVETMFQPGNLLTIRKELLLNSINGFIPRNSHLEPSWSFQRVVEKLSQLSDFCVRVHYPRDIRFYGWPILIIF